MGDKMQHLTAVQAPVTTAGEPGNALVVLDQVQQQLAAIRTVDEAKGLRDRADAILHYAKRSKQSQKDQNVVALVKFGCERRAGELLLEVQKVQGKRDGSKGLLATIKRTGVSTQTAYRWMNLARMPEDELLHAAALCDADGEELTTTLVYGVLVRAWMERHGTVPLERYEVGPRGPYLAREALSLDEKAAAAEQARRELLEWEVLASEDLEGLSAVQERVVVLEARALYEEHCVDVRRGKVETMEWSPWITVDRRFIRHETRGVVHDLMSGKIGHAAVRGRLRYWLNRHAGHSAQTGVSAPPQSTERARVVFGGENDGRDRFAWRFECRPAGRYKTLLQDFLAETRWLTGHRELLVEWSDEELSWVRERAEKDLGRALAGVVAALAAEETRRRQLRPPPTEPKVSQTKTH